MSFNTSLSMNGPFALPNPGFRTGPTLEEAVKMKNIGLRVGVRPPSPISATVLLDLQGACTEFQIVWRGLTRCLYWIPDSLERNPLVRKFW